MSKPQKVLLLGSGGLRIGQAGEFDYSGSQALKALREEGIYSILVNPNIATVQTNQGIADKVYFEPLNIQAVTKIIQAERPDSIMLGFGGQTALNLGLELHHAKVLQRYKVKVLGTPIKVIETTEDRQLFKESLARIKVKTARSRAVYSVKEALKVADEIGYPVMMRSGFSLGGLGSGKVDDSTELTARVGEVLHSVSQVLIEEYLLGWKEIEYEVMRDASGNAVTVCNMENFDPMGIHTGESIVVAPSQTLSNADYHLLREVALKTINHLGIIGECNIQYALHPETGDYRVIEVNARLSRSSALASKATGYPLAHVATKVLLGKRLDEITNAVTGTTSAFFEPALDYLAVKIPRWDLNKFKESDHRIGSEMKSVGEVMGLGRSFPEALQKAVRMLNIGADGLTSHGQTFKNVDSEIVEATDRRLFALMESLKTGTTVELLHQQTGITRWFLEQLKRVSDHQKVLVADSLTSHNLRLAKQLGFSDKTIGQLSNRSPEQIRKRRRAAKIIPVVKQIDTLAGEADAQTNYLYMTYHGEGSDLVKSREKPVMVLGSGPYCIGSSVEFDWCAVSAVAALRKHGRNTVMVNSNPETVSTDFDNSDRLYFEELTLERIQDIAEFESVERVVVSFGGQIANNLALPLHRCGYKLLGTTADNIDNAENRQKFSSILQKNGIDQPAWAEVTTLVKAKQFAKQVGYPVLLRPSYVLSGGAMNVVTNESQLATYLSQATTLSPDHPVVISQFIEGAKELEIDGVAQDGKLVIYAISEHIENAGIHSGDATVVYPAQRLYLETVRRAKKITTDIVGSLEVNGPFNIQFIAKENELKVIECNVRSSRSFPFVSKVSGYNFVDVAMEVMLGIHKPAHYKTLDLDHVGVKSPQFSYQRLKGADPVAGVEMASTGEVACMGSTINDAFYRSWQATEQQLVGKRIFVSLPDHGKHKCLEGLLRLSASGWKVFATAGTHQYLQNHGVSSQLLYKIHDNKLPSVAAKLSSDGIDLAINVPGETDDKVDAKTIRRLAVDNQIPLVTNAEVARQLLLSIPIE